MFEDEEERKKREEEARQIISSFNNSSSNINTVNYANLQGGNIILNNDDEKLYVQRIQEANDIINSINPREDVKLPEPTEEELAESERNGQFFMDLMDNGINSDNNINTNNTRQVDSIENNQNDNASRQDRFNVIARSGKPEAAKTEEEKQQETLQRLAQEEYASKTNSDKNWFSQFGKVGENALLGGINGLLQATKVVTDLDYQNKTQEATLLAANNPNIPETVKMEYINQNYNTPLERNVKQQMDNERFSLIRFTPEYQQANQNMENAIPQELKTNVNDSVKQYTNQYGEIELNPLQLQLEKAINENNQKINNNVNEIDNFALKKIAEVIPSATNSLVGAALYQVNPFLSIAYFTTSAMGSYEDNGRQMGMNKEESKAYSKIMGLMESVTEMVGISHFVKGAKLGLSAIKESLKYYGLSMADNAIQEAIIDPVDEGVAYLTSGKTKYDYSTPEGVSSLISDMIQDGFDGAISAMLVDGVGLGINSAITVYDKVQNGQQPTQQELLTAIEDINNDKRINVEDYFTKTFNYEKEKLLNGDTNNNYVAFQFDRDNNIIDAVVGQGTTINYDGDVDIKPVAMLINDNYNIIDANTGVTLISTPYQTIQEAEQSFNNYMDNMSNLQKVNLNEQLRTAKLSLIKTVEDADVDVRTGIKNTQIFDRDTTVQLLNQYGIEANNLPNRSYVGREVSDIIKNPNAYNYTRQAGQNQIEQANDSQTSSEPNSSTFYNTETNYAVQDINNVIEPFNKQKTYTKNQLAEVWNDEISDNDYDAVYDSNGNIQSYIAIEEDGNNLVVNQYDSNDNVVKSEIIPSNKGKYSAKDIQDTIRKVTSIYNEHRPIKGQKDIEGNEVRNMKNGKQMQSSNNDNKISNENNNNNTNNTEIINSIEKFEKAQNRIDRNTIITIANALNVYHKNTQTFIDKNMVGLSGNNSSLKLTIINNYFKEYKDKKELRKLAGEYALKNYKNKIVKIRDTKIDIDLSQKGLKKTFNIRQPVATLQTAAVLPDIIKESVYLNSSVDLDDNNFIYHYFYSPVKVNNTNTISMITIKEIVTDKNANPKFYYHDIKEINDIRNIKNKELLHAIPQQKLSKMLFEESPSIDNSISQKSKSVKNDTAINKQFMLNNNDYSHYHQKWKDKFKPSETNSNMLPEKHYNKLLDIGVDKNLIDYIGTNDIYNGYGKDRTYKTVTEYENIAKRNQEISEENKKQEKKDALNVKNRLIEEKNREIVYIQEYGITENQYKKLREAEIFRKNNSKELQLIAKEIKGKESGYYEGRKSIRAIRAELENKFPISVASKVLGVTQKTLEDNLVPTEWHHSNGSMYKPVQYYDISKYIDITENGIDTYINDTDYLDEIKTWLKMIKSTKTISDFKEQQPMQRTENNTSKTIKSLEDIKTKYKNQTDQLNIFENKDNTISINNLIVKENLRNQGIGQNILNDIIDYADKNNKVITLTPTSEYLTKNRLTDWYKRNGFVENKGKNSDFSISDTMYRLPKNNINNNVRTMKNNTSKNNNINTTTQVDSQGRLLSKQQQEYFKDSKVRNENGNLEVVYHTTTNVGEQFNVFDPRNTDFYRFGNQIVNYYTNSKEMSGSYADGNYEMAETTENINNTKKVKRQYEGYINITNPYIIDAEGNNWNQIQIETNDYGKKLLNEIDVLEKNNIYSKLKQIYDEIEHTSQEASNRFYEIQKKASFEQYHILGEYARWGNIDNIYENGLFNDQGKAKIANHINDTINGKTLKEIGLDLFNNKYETLLNKEINRLKKQYPSIKDFPLEDLDIIAEHYDEGRAYIENRYRNQKTTNDIVEKVIEMNKNGSNYDGIVIKNVRDYGGGKVESYTPANVYVTFNSNQFKNMNNTKPTENQDIRFAKKTAKQVNTMTNQGQRNAEREGSYIEQEIQKVEATGNWDDSIPITRMTDIKRTIEDYLGIGVKKSHFRQHAYGIYKGNRDVLRTKELKDMDTILHETGHALDLGKRINLNKESISNELLKAVERYGGYETETREIQLEEGFAEVIREYTIVPEQARLDYPQTVSVIEGIRQENKAFDDFISKVQQQTYNYIHQNPRNRVLSNQSIGERTDKPKWSRAYIQQEVMRNIYDKDYATKQAVEALAKTQGKKASDIKASENAYYLVRLSNGIGDKVTSMLSEGYIDENGNKLMPGLNQIGEILGNDPQKFNDLRSYLVAQRDLEYKAKTLKTGIRTMDSKAVVEQFKNDKQIQEASKIVYDTLDGVLQYAVNNGLITQETAQSLRESNVFYVPMQRVLEGNKNNVGRRGAVADIIKKRTGSELDVKDVLENIITNSSNVIQQVENNNILKALYNEGESTGLTGTIYDVIPPSMTKIGTAKLSTWENELKNQGIDTSKIDFDKTIDLFAPSNKVDSQNLITSFIDNNGKRVYLQFNDEILFNSIMNMDKKFMSSVLNINRKLNMPLRYGATMANIGFAIPNMISDTAQAAIYSEAGFIPVVDNIIGIMDILSVQNKSARNFFNKVMPGYADRINTLYAIYSQTGSTSSTRLSQYRESTQNLMRDVYGTKNNEVLGIKEQYKPLKRLLDVLTYIPELSEQSTRFRVFEKNLEYYRNKGMAETDARIKAALQSRDATQDFGRTGNLTREINQLIPFSAARVGSAYTFAEKVKANPKQVAMRTAVLMTIGMIIKAMGYDDKEIEELNQRKKDDNFVLKIGDQVVTIKKPQGILRSILNLGEYVQDLFTGHIEGGKEGERLTEWITNTLTDNLPAESFEAAFSSMPGGFLVENAINKDFYYNNDIVKSYDLDLPDSEQYYEYNSQLAIWLGKVFNYSPAKIDNAISGFLGGLGTSVTNVIDWIAGKTGLAVEQPEMGAEDNAVARRFIVNVNSYSASVDEIYNLKTDLTKKKNGGTITEEETKQLETITNAINEMSKLNKQIREIKADTVMSGEEKAEQIKLLQNQKTDTARQALGKDLIYSENESKIESTKLYPTRDALTQNSYTLTMDSEMKKEYEQVANEYYNKYAKQGLYSDEKLEQIKDKSKDYAKNYMMKKYKNQLIKNK